MSFAVEDRAPSLALVGSLIPETHAKTGISPPTHTEDNPWRTLRLYLESIRSSAHPIDEVTSFLTEAVSVESDD